MCSFLLFIFLNKKSFFLVSVVYTTVTNCFDCHKNTNLLLLPFVPLNNKTVFINNLICLKNQQTPQTFLSIGTYL